MGEAQAVQILLGPLGQVPVQMTTFLLLTACSLGGRLKIDSRIVSNQLANWQPDGASSCVQGVNCSECGKGYFGVALEMESCLSVTK